MSFLENEVLLRAAISNVADIRGTKVKFKGFDMGSYRRSLGVHLGRLFGNNIQILFNSDKIRIAFPCGKIFSDTPVGEKTSRINEMLFKPYILGETKKPVHSFYAYNAGDGLKAICRLRNYMASTEYLSDNAINIDEVMFSGIYYQASYDDYDKSLLTESRVAYHDFVRAAAFDVPTEPIANDNAPYLESREYWFYHHREDVVLLNLRQAFFNQDMMYPSFTLFLPYRALLDREFLTIIAGMNPSNNESNNE